MSMDTLMMATQADMKPLTVALDRFRNISLISIYSSTLSSEELDVINVHQLTEQQTKKLRKTILKLNNFKKKRKKQVDTSSSVTHSTFVNNNKTKKSATIKNMNIETDFDHLLSCDMLENHDVFRSVSSNLSNSR